MIQTVAVFVNYSYSASCSDQSHPASQHKQNRISSTNDRCVNIYVQSPFIHCRKQQQHTEVSVTLNGYLSGFDGQHLYFEHLDHIEWQLDWQCDKVPESCFISHFRGGLELASWFSLNFPLPPVLYKCIFVLWLWTVTYDLDHQACPR